MKQIFGNSAVSLVAVERSVVFASLEKKLENGEFKSWLTFHQHNFDTGVTNAITKNAYLNFLFTSHNEFLKENLDKIIQNLSKEDKKKPSTIFANFSPFTKKGTTKK